MNRPIRHLAAAVACAVLVSSCTSMTVDAVPGSAGYDVAGYDVAGYDVVFEFDNVLNLPDRAKVMLDGISVGVVTAVELVSNRVAVTSRIDSGVRIPSDIIGVLQQATVLGEIYIALERPPAGGVDVPPLGAGDVVPLAQTTSPPQIEDTIANLANFVASGSIQRAQNTLIGLNRVAETGEVDLSTAVAQVSTNLADLADNIEAVDLTLSGMADTSTILSAKTSSFEYWFSPAGMLGFDRATQVTSRLSVMIPSIGSVYSGGFWLLPMLTNVGDAVGAVQGSKWAVEDEIPRWRRLFTDYFLPQDKYPAINITSIVGPDGRELSGDVHDVLRVLGATP